MSQRQTFQDPEQLSQLTIAEDLTRNVHGESLDDARAEFRAEWQAKIERKREQAEQARRTFRYFQRGPGVISVIAAIGGAVFAAVRTAGGGGAWFIPVGAFAGSILGWAFTSPLVPASIVAATVYRRRAERLEREGQELEHS